MRNSIIIMSIVALLAGCRSPGLPPEPPEQDPANPAAGRVESRPQANPFTKSAFEGVNLDGAGGHEHHHHGHGAKKPAAAEAQPAKGDAPVKAEKPAASSHDSHGSHGSHGGRS